MPAEQASLFAAAPCAVAPDDLVAFRYSTYDVPFWVRPNAEPQRWNAAGEAPTQYWSLTPDGAWAELIRANSLASEAELDQVQTPIWVCRTSRMGLADLYDPAVRAQYDLTVDDLTAAEWTTCQQAATEMRARGVRGILSPSAAMSDAVNVTLFGPRRAISFDRRPALASAIPAAVVAIGRPPKRLHERVIHSKATNRLF